jgi:all-trans-retinol dehydrogenase (NAD+)
MNTANAYYVVPNVHFYEVDITSSENIHEAAEKIRKDHGDPTVLINNAGIGTNKTILDETETEMRRVFDVNTISHFLLVKEFVPAMIKRNHGHIVTVASMASFLVHAQNVDYTCTKASALAFHEGLGQELKSRHNAKKVRTT